MRLFKAPPLTPLRGDVVRIAELGPVHQQHGEVAQSVPRGELDVLDARDALVVEVRGGQTLQGACVVCDTLEQLGEQRILGDVAMQVALLCLLEEPTDIPVIDADNALVQLRQACLLESLGRLLERMRRSFANTLRLAVRVAVTVAAITHISADTVTGWR